MPKRNKTSEIERKIPATERVQAYVLEEMDAGRLQPGSRVNAAKIAEQLKLSAAPVREALCVLAGRGVVDLLPDRGAVMRPISAREVCMMWEMLVPIGAVGLKLAAEACTAGGDTSDIRAAYDAIRNDPFALPPLQFILRLNDWHYAVNRLGGNEFVNLALERLGVPYWDRYLVELIDVHANMKGYQDNYRRMHEAVMFGDGLAASAVMKFHADWSVALIRQAEAAMPKTRRSRRSS